MSLLHPVLLSGLGLAVIPILLHLLLRAKPKRLIFPALRLIQQNRRQNVRRLQLRHLWLLLLRVLVITLIVLGLSRPSLPAANYSLSVREWTTLLVIVVASLGAYFAVFGWWQRQNWHRNQLLTRRTILRGGIGAAAVLLLILFVAWPYAHRLSAEIKAPAPKVAENVPVAAVLLFDTSSSMSYRQGNQTRLQLAQQIARDHLSRLPGGSKVAVAVSHEAAAPAFSLDLQASRSRIDACEINAGSFALNDRLRTVLLAQEEDRRRVTAEQSGPEEKRQDRYVREIYLFTDLTKSAWRAEASSLLRDEMKRLETIGVYLIDVGETAPSNVGFTSLNLSREMLTSGGTLKLNVTLSAVGNVKPEQKIEVLLGGADGKLVKRSEQEITFEPGSERQLTFEVPGITGRYQQGEVRIVGSDPLAADDVEYFTVQTMQPLKVLIVAETDESSKYWKLALELIAKEKDKLTDFRPQSITSNRFRSTDVTPFDLVCLVNVSTPDEATWMKLRDFVNAGGGLCVFLGADSSAATERRTGERIDPDYYNSKTAQTVLPAQLKASLTHSPAQPMDLRQSPHMLLKHLDDLNALVELGAVEIRRYWSVEPQADAIVVARYSDDRGSPALVERRLGEGRVMVMTTSIDNPEWNDLLTTPWFFVFADQLMQYLSQQVSLRSNYQVGDEVALPVDRERKPKKVVLRMPDFKQRSIDLAADAKSILLRDLTTIGPYQVDSVPGGEEFHAGFSLNLPAREGDLTRLELRDLESLLGEGRYTVNRDPASLERNVQTGRLGQEMYSLIVSFLVAVFALEQFTATWFYRTDET